MNLFDLAARITLDSSEYEKGMQEASQKTSNFGGKLKKAFGTVAKVGAAGLAAGSTAAVKLVKDATNAYAEYEQLIGGTELLFGGASDSIVEKSKEAYKTVQMSQNDYLQQVNGFAVGLKTALGGNEQAAADLSARIIQAEADVVAATGNSQEAVQNAFNGIMKSNYTMLDNLQLGIKPTKEGMQEVIDKVNDWNKANGNATKYEIDNLADVQSALVDYIEMQGLSGYAANEAAGTIQGSLASTKASWENLLTAMARGDATVSGAMDAFLESVTNTAGNIIPVAKTALRGIVRLVKELGPQLVQEIPGIVSDVLPGVIDAGISILGALVDTIVQNLDVLMEAAGQIISTLVSKLMEVLTSTDWTQVGRDIVQFIMNIDWAGLFSEAASLLGGLAGALVGLFSGIFEEALGALGEWLYGHFGGTADMTWQGFLDGLLGALGDIGSWLLANVIDPFVSAFAEALGFNGDEAVQAMHEWVTNVFESLRTAVNNAVQWGANLVNNVKTGFSSAWSGVKTFFTKTFNSITDIVKKPFESAKTIVSNAINFIKGLFNFSWSLPKLKLPHFSVGKGPTVLGIDLPKINIEWYKKAYENPYVFNRPTVVGTGTGLKGFGDGSGGEIVYGRNNLLTDIKQAILELSGGSGMRPINLYLDKDTLIASTAKDNDRAIGRETELKLRFEG